MAHGSIPVHSKEEYTDVISPNVQKDVPAPPADSLNERAWQLHAERQDYSPKFSSASRPGKKSA
jgi:hypothetical protein